MIVKAGCPSMVGKLEDVVVVDPRQAFQTQEAIDSQWEALNYLSQPDLHATINEFESLVDIFRDLGVSVHLFETSETLSLDSIYVRDSSLITPSGKAIICRMGKDNRISEPYAVREYYSRIGISVQGEIEAPGTLEGGDVAWLGPRTIVVGRSYRTNQEGIDQLKSILDGEVQTFITVDLPHFRGPDDVLHLMSMLSPLRSDTVLVYPELMPVGFIGWLTSKAYTLIEIEPSEYDSLACNVLAIDDKTCLMVHGNPQTRARIEKAGIEVVEFAGDNLCLKGSGGPTCLTRPLSREA